MPTSIKEIFLLALLGVVSNFSSVTALLKTIYSMVHVTLSTKECQNHLQRQAFAWFWYPTSLVSSTIPASAEEIRPQDWALRTSKKATRFSERQKSYLDENFSIGQETGHKIDTAPVTQNMRYAKDESGNRLFAVDEFLSPQQFQSYFARAAAKLKNRQEATAEEDVAAVEDQAAYSLTRTTVLENCQIVHPIVYESFNLCTMGRTKGIQNVNHRHASYDVRIFRFGCC